jgi:bifunctional non-homologous end joining protein LigD
MVSERVSSARRSRLLLLGVPPVEQFPLFPGYGRPLRFVVKRHQATRLTTDFRLEACETLMSWYSDELPSLLPQASIWAHETHDPGAGPVVVWDCGTYWPLLQEHANSEQAVVAGLRRGELDFWLEGHRLQGGFRLARVGADWRLTELDDEFASAESVSWDKRSILTGRSLDDLEVEYQRERVG